MNAEKNAWTTWFCRRHAVLSAAMIACCCSMMLGCKKASGPGAPAAKTEDTATRELRTIGERAVAAVVLKDINPLLEYDHDPEDEASLKNKSGDLYCYLF